MSKWTYSVGDDDDYQFDAPSKAVDSDLRFMATLLADDYHSNHDGWEASWPVPLTIFEDGEERGRFDVDRESRPHFYAQERART